PDHLREDHRICLPDRPVRGKGVHSGPSMTEPRITCPRCGESLPATLDVCDACGYQLDAHASRAVNPPAARTPSRTGRRGGGRKVALPSIAWLLLIVGLVVGGMVGYALHSALGPRAEGGAPQGPADL